MRDGDPNYHALDLYYPEYCEKAIELLGQGETLNFLASALDIDRKTLDVWRKKHPEFDYACSKGRTRGLAHWEKVGDQNLDNQKYNTTMYIFKMKTQYQVRDSEERPNVLVAVDGNGADPNRVEEMMKVVTDKFGA